MSEFERLPEEGVLNIDRNVELMINDMAYHDGYDGYVTHLHHEYEDASSLRNKIHALSIPLFCAGDENYAEWSELEDATAFYEGALLGVDAMYRMLGEELWQEWDELEELENDALGEGVFSLGDMFDDDELTLQQVRDFASEGRAHLSDAVITHIRNLSDEASIEPQSRLQIEEGFCFVVHRALEALAYVAVNTHEQGADNDEMTMEAYGYLSEVVGDADTWNQRWDDVAARLQYGYSE